MITNIINKNGGLYHIWCWDHDFSLSRRITYVLRYTTDKSSVVKIYQCLPKILQQWNSLMNTHTNRRMTWNIQTPAATNDASSWFISSPRSSHLTIVIITTIIIHHPVILPFQTQNVPISQILPSIDIWHLFGLISQIPGLHYGFFSDSVFSSFQLSLFASV